MDERKLPIELGVIPIVELVVEIRFSALIEPEGILGMVLNLLREKNVATNVEKLPITQLPPQIINMDKNLHYQPWYRLKTQSATYIVAIGPKVLTLHMPGKDYKTWGAFFEHFKLVFTYFDSLKIIKHIERIGVRYINFFNDKKIPAYDVSKLNYKISIADWGVGEGMQFQTTVKNENVFHTLRLIHQAEIDSLEGKENGDVVDIDSYQEVPCENNKDKIFNIVQSIHVEHKKAFFKLIGEEVTSLLKPRYE